MRLKTLAVLFLVSIGLLMVPGTANADHTDPREKQAETQDPKTTELLTFGEGEWTFIRNFPLNPGTDIKLFKRQGRTFAAAGTLGQGDEQHVGQRIIKLTNKGGKVRPRWWADHGSANCQTNNTGVTSLQHDNAVTPKKSPVIMFDTTDTTGRCHDPGGGGLELVDVGGPYFPREDFKPREVHLTRHVGTSHTVTVDDKRPWIIYNNSGQSTGAPWIEVLNIKSCMNRKLSLEEKRAKCRPVVSRIYFEDEWARRIDAAGEQVEGTEASCHDITARGNRLYCANLNSTIILDVENLTDDKGRVRGDPLKCEVIDGTNTTAKVTDCSGAEVGDGQARGWKYIGHFNHPGRNGTHNTNTEYTRTEGIAVSHEAEPTPNGKFMFVTDERGGGLVPGGASCAQDPNPYPYDNGGVHVFKGVKNGDLSYAKNPEGENAVFIGAANVPSATFCTSHVMEQIAGEQRFAIAWYTQGTKIVDYFIDDNGRWTFRETASVIPTGPEANTWTSQVFKKEKNDDGTVTYWFLANDVTRGLDIFKWTGPANPMGTPPPAEGAQQERSTGEGSAAALLLLGSIPALLQLRRRRSS